MIRKEKTECQNVNGILSHFLCLCLVGVYISGVLAAIGSAFLGLFSILSVIQLSMISSRDKVVMSYKPLVIIKLVLAIVSGMLLLKMIQIYHLTFSNLFFCFRSSKAILALVAAILFGWEIDNVDVVNRNYGLSRGVSFYLQVSKKKKTVKFHSERSIKLKCLSLSLSLSLFR